LKGQEGGPDRLSRNVGNEIRTYGAKKAQKNENVIYTAAEARNLSSFNVGHLELFGQMSVSLK
jgi:hypothetical protein